MIARISVRLALLVAWLALPGIASAACVGALQANNNLTDVCDTAAARAALGVGTGTGTVISVATGTGLTGGPITTTGTVTLANTAVSPATYGSSSLVPVITIDQQGRITTATTAAITSGASALTINAQTGTTYTVVNGDLGKLVTFTNASGIVVTLPQAGSGGNFTSGWYAYFRNIGATNVRIQPATSTISGANDFYLSPNTNTLLVSDGTNYYALTYASGGTGINSASIASAWNQSVTGQNAGAYSASNTNASTISGTSSAILAASGNNGNTLSGDGSALIATSGGNTVSAPSSAVLGGGNQTISGAGSSAIIAATGSSVTGRLSAIVGGYSHSMSGVTSVALGSTSATDRGRSGLVVQGGNSQGAASLTQLHFSVVLSARLQNTAQTEMLWSDGTYATTYLSLVDNTAMNVMVRIVCQNRSNVADNVAMILMTGTNPGALAYRGAGVATTAVGGAPVFNAIATSGNGTEISATFTADTTNGRAAVKVTASSSRDWFCGAYADVVETKSN